VAANGAEVEVWLKVTTSLPPTGPSPATPESLLDEALLRKGLISRIPQVPSAADLARFNSYSPAAIEGKPLSESIVEDRR
jgi:hypothetical protein